MKKTLCILFVLLLIWSAVPFKASAQTAGEELDDKRIAHLHQRMAAITAQYPAGSYFTDNGKACTHHFNCRSMGNCNCKEPSATEAGTEGNYQCFGFARFVFYQLFGLPFPGYNGKTPWKTADSEESKNVTALYSEPGGTLLTKEEMKTLYSQCAFGDVIQVGAPHSMIFLGMKEDGIEVYDANYNLVDCKVQVHLVSWDRLCQYLSRGGMSIYRCAEYPQWSESATLTLSATPKDPMTVTGSDLSGLTFEYTKRDVHYIITCDENGTFTYFDGVSHIPVSDPKVMGLSLSLIPGERFDSGTLRFTFLDASVESREEILPTAEGILEFSPPGKNTYYAGEELSVSDAYVYLQHPEKGRVFLSSKDLVFTGFESSRPGRQTVKVTALEYETSFEVVVLPEAQPQKEPPAASPPTEENGIPAIVWIICALVMVAAGVFLWLFTRKNAKHHGKKKEIV